RTGQQFQERMHGLQGFLSGWFGPSNARGPAAATLYGQLLRQASSWAYVDIFRWTALLCFVCLFVVWSFKKVRPGRGPSGAH
ncbi:MAG: EmrB/QacA family drug resistance transporter, partial [Acidobacteriaceae bacterium]|nr:EmrB/QacA family drug resistance transporter [Acidobacteriaceae bacterium]